MPAQVGPEAEEDRKPTSKKTMAGRRGAKVKVKKEDGFVRVRESDLERLTTEIMQLRDLLPKVLNGNLIETLRQAQVAQTMREHLARDKEQFRQECLHLQSRLGAAQTKCRKEREEKLQLREQLWQSRAELQQQVDFCSGLGSAAGSLLWSSSTNEHTVMQWLADGKLQSFLTVAAQTLESFVRSLDEEGKTETEDPNSQEYQFALALAGTITNIAAVTYGRDFLCSLAHGMLDTLMALLQLMKPGVVPRLKSLMLMALYNVSIGIKGLRYITENPGLLPLIKTLLNDGDWEVCLHSLRLLQSMLVEEEMLIFLGSSLLDPDIQACVSRLTSAVQPCLGLVAQQTLEQLHALQHVLQAREQ
ncbi:heat shock factor 2-binding protein [Chaetodon auriga]|uniref:heat shock factor 2-binding protein n=1 Tax=Chaetodon auriga TaxID=39042 RepID=UPI004032E4C5